MRVLRAAAALALLTVLGCATTPRTDPTQWRSDASAFAMKFFGSDLSRKPQPGAQGLTHPPETERALEQVRGERVSWAMKLLPDFLDKKEWPLRANLGTQIRRGDHAEGMVLVLPRKESGSKIYYEKVYEHIPLNTHVRVTGRIDGVLASYLPDTGMPLLVVELYDIRVDPQ